MITLAIILVVLALLFMAISGVCAILVDPILAILILYGLYRLVKRFVFNKKKKK